MLEQRDAGKYLLVSRGHLESDQQPVSTRRLFQVRRSRILPQADASIEYEHSVELAPTQEMLDRYKKLKGAWTDYEAEFIELIKSRGIVDKLSLENLTDACLLCSEDRPTHCHRRLVADPGSTLSATRGCAPLLISTGRDLPA